MHTFQIRLLLQETPTAQAAGPALVETETLAAIGLLAGFALLLLKHMVM